MWDCGIENMHSVFGDYTAMTSALRQDPVTLYKILKAKHEKVSAALTQSGLPSHMTEDLSKAKVALEAAIERTVLKLNQIAAAEEAEIPEDAPPLPEDEPLDEGTTIEDDVLDPAEEEPPLEEELPTDEPPAEAPVDIPVDAPLDDVKEESPVAMSSKLRKSMSDPAADIMDDYAMKIYTEVNDFFTELTTRALDLGVADSSDRKSSLREVLLDEVGRRGLQAVEQNFAEWRAALMKRIGKSVTEMFDVPSTHEEMSSDFPVNVPATPDTAPPPAASDVAPEAPTEPTTPVIEAMVKPMSFVVQTDLKPAGVRRSVRLT